MRIVPVHCVRQDLVNGGGLNAPTRGLARTHVWSAVPHATTGPACEFCSTPVSPRNDRLMRNAPCLVRSACHPHQGGKSAFPGDQYQHRLDRRAQMGRPNGNLQLLPPHPRPPSRNLARAIALRATRKSTAWLPHPKGGGRPPRPRAGWIAPSVQAGGAGAVGQPERAPFPPLNRLLPLGASGIERPDALAQAAPSRQTREGDLVFCL